MAVLLLAGVGWTEAYVSDGGSGHAMIVLAGLVLFLAGWCAVLPLVALVDRHRDPRPWTTSVAAVRTPAADGVHDPGRMRIATLRHRLLAVPGRLTTHAREHVLRLSPGQQLLPTALARLRALPAPT